MFYLIFHEVFFHSYMDLGLFPIVDLQLYSSIDSGSSKNS